MDNMEKTTTELLDEQIRKTLEELDDGRIFTDESVKPVLERLKILHSQQMEAQKLEIERVAKARELELNQLKIDKFRHFQSLIVDY